MFNRITTVTHRTCVSIVLDLSYITLSKIHISHDLKINFIYYSIESQLSPNDHVYNFSNLELQIYHDLLCFWLPT